MIQIITDSTCDMEREEAARLGIEMVPLSVLFGQESLQDGIDISKAEFYTRLAGAETLPTTSQVNPDAFLGAFGRCLERGDSVLGVFLSAKLSGTFQSAVIAREALGGEIRLVDSGTVTVGLGLLLRHAAFLRDGGASLQEMERALTALSGRIHLVAMVNTLKYLKMGGRISATTAMVGGLLGISPIISVEDGVIESIGKVRGTKAGIAFFEDYLKAHPMDGAYPAAFAHSRCRAELEPVMAHFAFPDCFCDEIGSVVGTHAGPGAYGLAYIGK